MQTQFKNKRAFTLIELLIVIAIIGILFIVLVSRVDFATDKAKATGVQTDFRSFQVAFDTVAKENAGFNTFGYNTGDTKRADFDTALPGYTYTNEATDKGDGIRNSYDAGDKNLNGKQDVNGQNGYTGTTEVFTGRKVYTENWTEVYTLVKPGTTGLDATAVFALESAINANLDPKLHISIDANGKITMANQARDPWENEYHGAYISEAERDNGVDRGAIIIYSNGANGQHGSEHDITNGVVTVTVPGNNVNGQDDYSIVSCYTYINGFGEVKNVTTGFSINMSYLAGNGLGDTAIDSEGNVPNSPVPALPQILAAGLYETGTNKIIMDWDTLVAEGVLEVQGGGNLWVHNSERLTGDLHVVEGVKSVSSTIRNCSSLTGIFLPESFNTLFQQAFENCSNLQTVVFHKNAAITTIYIKTFSNCTSLTTVVLSDNTTVIDYEAFSNCTSLTTIDLPSKLSLFGERAFTGCSSILAITIPDGVQKLPPSLFYGCTNLKTVNIHDRVQKFGLQCFANCSSLESIHIPYGTTTLPYSFLNGCVSLTSVSIPDTVTLIDQFAFKDCTFETLVIPNSVTSIKAQAFNCDITNIYLPSSLNDVERRAFGTASSLVENVYFNGTINEYINSLGRNECWFSSIQNLYVMNNGSYELLEHVIIDETHTSLPRYVFQDIACIKSVEIADTVTSVGMGAFQKCNNLELVVLPISATYENATFHLISPNATIICESTTPPYIPDCSFTFGITVYVPGEAMDAYINSPTFSSCKILPIE